jgi:hypothetical protein
MLEESGMIVKNLSIKYATTFFSGQIGAQKLDEVY